MSSQRECSATSKKIKAILSMRLENDKETLQALKELSNFFPLNTAFDRRNLRSNIQEKTLKINKELFLYLNNVHQTLGSIYQHVQEMNSLTKNMMVKLSVTKEKTRSLIDETTQLQQQAKAVETKQEICAALIERFQLLPSEVTALRAVNVNSDILSAILRTEEIHNRCKILARAGCTTLAQDIMDQMSLYQENGIERLFRWSQARCRTIDQPDPNVLLPKVMAKLQSRGALFDQVMEEYCANRRDLLVRQLISALTRGGRPIEHRVTEPKRYVGDMLAWLHQALPAERDSLAYLLRFCDSLDVSERIQQSLCSITEGVCHPLKVRIEHIVLGSNNVRDPLLLHSLLGLLRYYHDIINQVVGASLLQRTLFELIETAEKTLIISLTARVAVLLGSQGESIPPDLSLTPGVAKVLGLLTQILAGDVSLPSAVVEQIVSCVVDPLLIHITESAMRLPSVESSVFLLNNYHGIKAALALHAFLDEQLEKLKSQSDAQTDALVAEQTKSLVSNLSLGPVYTTLQSNTQKPLSRMPAFDAVQISTISSKLAKITANPGLYLLPQLTLLSSVNQRQEILKRAGTIIHGIYTQLHTAVNDPENLFPHVENLLPLSPDVVLKAFANT